ncbi:hypothetical protein FQA39_LY01371 [Lamprigera yunnana]|nr:hypothetical protein FQA39_LY01371 [Lamprigera yunnana]
MTFACAVVLLVGDVDVTQYQPVPLFDPIGIITRIFSVFVNKVLHPPYKSEKYCSLETLFTAGTEFKISLRPRGRCKICCPLKVESHIRIHLTTTFNNQTILLKLINKLGYLKSQNFDKDLPTIMYIHGFTEHGLGISSNSIRDAYLSRNESYNIMQVDWGCLASFPWYTEAVNNSIIVGKRLGKFLKFYNNSGELRIDKLHLIGFSLGSHISGFIGKFLGKSVIGRITALDPAYPQFSDMKQSLTKNDAQYVDVIHTDGGVFGIPISIGHADFYPNGGAPVQPGCEASRLSEENNFAEIVLCNHFQAWRFYAESVKTPKSFPATKCGIVENGTWAQCEFRTHNYMGFSVNKSILGFASQAPEYTDTVFHQKAVRVAVLGASTRTGEMLAYLLKQNPIISQIYLYGDQSVFGIGGDLKHFDTRSEVKAYCGVEGLGRALRRADIVALVGSDSCPLDATVETRLKSEMDLLLLYTDACTKFAPKSLIAVCVRPVSVTLPVVTELFKRTHWYHPARVIGSAALAQVFVVNAYFGSFQNLDPKCVHVPIIGGPDTENVVPLLSRATPIRLELSDVKKVYSKMKDWKKTSAKNCKQGSKGRDCQLSEAYAINQLVSTMALGLCGDDYAISTAFVRQNLLSACKYLVSTVQFGPTGLVHNFGIPQLSKFELMRFEETLVDLQKLEAIANDAVTKACSQQIEEQSNT